MLKLFKLFGLIRKIICVYLGRRKRLQGMTVSPISDLHLCVSVQVKDLPKFFH